MVTKAPAGTDWFGRVLVPILLLALGTAQTGVVIYFSSQAAAIEKLRSDMNAATNAISAQTFQNKQDIAVLRQAVDGDRPRELERRR